MLPLLWFADSQKIISIKENILTLIIASLFCALSNAAAGKSYHYISVGLASAFQQSIFVLGVSFASIYMFQEKIVLMQVLAIVVLIFGIYLSTVDGKGLSLQFNEDTIKGLFYSLLFGVLQVIGFTNMSKLSRATDPFLAAYFWEFTIGLFGLLFYILKNKFNLKKETAVSFKDFFGVLVASSPTVIGTGCIAVAATLGSISIISAILSGVVAFCSLFAYFLYKEKLTSQQIVGMIIVVISVILINILKS